ncbi:MAG: glutathione peroxidase [Phycisphaerales bacterium]|nr:MAG: glutathione peroxidase [Phycisphaerales bacterium]
MRRVAAVCLVAAVGAAVALADDGLGGSKQEGAAGQAPAGGGADAKPSARSGKETSVLDFTVKDIDGKDVALSKYAGDVLLIVNVATKCGLTQANYTALEPLYQKYKDQGLRILAFPCNDFGGQEPGSHEEIKTFCRVTHHGTYGLFSKVKVKGDEADPLYRFLTRHPDEKVAGEVKWNFQKYLVGRDGKSIEKFDPRVAPDDPRLTEAIEKALKVERPKPAEGAGRKG